MPTETKPLLDYKIEPMRKGVVVRPAGTCGTCGWVNGVPWTAQFFSNSIKAGAWIEKQKGAPS